MNKTLILTSFCALIGLTACGGAQEALGLRNSAPDEFAVVKRAPLELPPDYSLRPPRPGALRPQESRPDQDAEEALFGVRSEQPIDVGASEAALLQQAGAGSVPANIRETIDRESAEITEQNTPLAEKVLGVDFDGESVEPVIDPVEEKERLENAN